MKKNLRNSRKSLRLENLESRQLLTSAPVAVPDSFSVQEDTVLSFLPSTETIVPAGADWYFLDNGSDQGTAWQEPNFSEAGWGQGPAQLGYGDGDEATEVSFGPDENNKYPTTYFRHHFDVAADLAVTGLTVELVSDDGAAVYLNGVEVVRDNVPLGAQFDDYALTTTQNESGFTPYDVDPILLVAGDNVLAVEVHQADASSSDISFDLRLNAVIGLAGVLSNDVDADGDVLTASLISEPDNGSITFNSDGTFAYFPAPNFFGTDSFTYIASDGALESDPATVTIQVQSVNDSPFGASDRYHALMNTTLNVGSAAGVLRNDLDIEGSNLTASVVTNVSHGSLTLNANGSFAYTPSGGFVGDDSFTYVASDGTDVSGETTANILVTATNAAPEINNDSYVVDEDATLAIDLPTIPEPQLFFFTNFDDGIPPVFSGVASAVGVEGFAGLGNEGNQFSGALLRNDGNPLSNGDPALPTILTLTNLPPHDSVDIGFLFAALDEWDVGGGFGGSNVDFLNVSVDGNVVFSQSFDSENPGNQSYVPPPGGAIIENQSVWNPNNNFESAYDMSLEPSLQKIPHSSPNLVVEWFGSGPGYRVQGFFGIDNESLGLDNVSVVLNRGSVGVVNREEYVAEGSSWRYLDDGSDQGEAWRQTGFNDSSWQQGAAQLGYGDGDEATIVDFGPDAGNKYPTTYFRHVFQANGVADVSSLTLSLLRDDGAAVYLNGVEVVRDNVPDNAQFNDYASNTTQTENTFFNFAIDPSLLVEGDNLLAVEVHQADASSSDISFDLSLEATIEEGNPLNEFGVLSNDLDPELGPLTAELITGTSNGSLTFNPDGTFVYTPNTNYHGTDSFTYRGRDGFGASGTATVTITVIPGPNEPPIVQNKTYSVNEDLSLSVLAANGLLAGAQDEDNDPLTAFLDTEPTHGSVTVLPNGAFTYTPDADYFGPDTFTYVAYDTLANSLPGTVTINVAGQPDAPRATGDQYFIEPGDSLSIAAVAGVLANDVDVDGQPITAVLVGNVSNGTLTLNANGSFTYVPANGFHATDSFTYRASDGPSMSAVVTVLLTVDASPVAVADNYSTPEDVTLNRSALQGVLANDSDGENDPLTALLVGPPQHGTVNLSSNGAFVYTPAGDYFGSDSFTYRANDADQDSNLQTVTISVSAVNDRPVANNDVFGVVQNGALTVSAVNGVLANDIDVDSAILTVQLVANGGPAHGVLALLPNGSFTYTPAADYLGPDQFRYTVSDGSLTSIAATATIVVTDPAEDVVISEIMYHPSSENDAEEYIEIHNKGLGIVDLTGWRISKGVDFVFPAVTLSAGEYLVVAADTGVFAANYPQVTATVVGGWTGQLSNSGEEVEIETADGERIDRVEYADEGDWAVRRVGPNDAGTQGWVWEAPHDGGGSSLELINPAAPNRHGQNWAASSVVGGTPGATNSVASTSTAPLIYDVKHSPAIPSPNQPVTVTADLADDTEGVISAEVFYRISTMTPGPFVSAPMFDDGLHGDGKAGDGRFGVTLPGRPDQTLVEFYVRASDEQSNSRTWPAPTDDAGTQGANAVYQVDTEAYDGGQPIYRLVLTAQENNRLETINRQSDAQMNATFINFDGTGADIRYNVGVRIRGNGTRGRTPPNNRVNFPSDAPWQGVDAINLNSQYPHGQLLGMTLFELAGLPQEDATAVQIRRNGQQIATTPAQQGSFVRLEVTNGDWASSHYPNDPAGNLYRGTNGPLQYNGDNANNYRNGYRKQSNTSEDDWTDLIALTRALDRNQTPDNVFVQTVEQVADINQWMRFIAMNTLLVNEENGLINGRGDDYGLYCGVIDPRCLLLVHDMDTIFAEGDQDANTATVTRDIFEPRLNPAFDRLMGVPEYLDLYYYHLRDLATTVFSEEQLIPLMDNILGDWVDPNILDEMKTFAIARSAWVLTQIPADIHISPVATISGEPPAVTPFGTASVLVGGEGVTQYQYRVNEGAFSPLTPVATPISLSGLADGAYVVEVVGVNAVGAIQDEPTLSRTWTVDSQYSNIIINEVLAANQSTLNHEGTFPDAIEFFNRGTTVISMTGMKLSDDPSMPDRFTFPAGTSINPGEYLVVYADDSTTSGLHTGFGLSEDGDGVYLYAAGGDLLDHVEFGMQVDNFSISRNAAFEFVLSPATFGQPNARRRMGSASNLRINEWLASGGRFTPDDFFEIYNLDPNPVALGGLFLTDNPVGWPAHFEIAPLSFIAGSGYRVFVADDDESAGANHVNFNLNANRDSIALLDRHLNLIDMAIVLTQTTDVSQGLSPDGSRTVASFGLPTPGASNVDNPVAARLLNSLRITELMYNPPGSAEDSEFIELQNVGALPIDLTGVRLRGGVSFTFPSLTVQPNEIIVLANDLATFQSVYGTQINVVGEYTGNLDNSGEEIRLQLPSPLDIDILRFSYDDDPNNGWPAAADNGGASLVILDTEGDYNDGANWRASVAIGGTPGSAGVEIVGDFDLNGVLGQGDLDLLYGEIAAGTDNSDFDLTGDGTVDVDDLNNWIVDQKKTSLGDANLDFSVDASDFNIWNDNKFTAVDSWARADFNADGVTDATDFNIWFGNRFTARPVASAAPSGQQQGRHGRVPRQAAVERADDVSRAIAADAVFAASLERRMAGDGGNALLPVHHDDQGAENSRLTQFESYRRTSRLPRRFSAQSPHEEHLLVDEALGEWQDEFIPE